LNAPEFYRTRVMFQHITFVAVHQVEENNLHKSTACEGMEVDLYRHAFLASALDGSDW